MKSPRLLAFIAFALVVLSTAVALALSAAKRRAESLGCASIIPDICLDARVWAEDRGGMFPTNFVCMSNELTTPKVLVCPADHSRRRAEDWSSFTPTNSSYEIVSPGMRADETNRVFLRCTVHGHLGYGDTTVFDGVRRRHKFE